MCSEERKESAIKAGATGNYVRLRCRLPPRRLVERDSLCDERKQEVEEAD